MDTKAKKAAAAALRQAADHLTKGSKAQFSKHQQAIIRQNKAAKRLVEDFPPGQRVEVSRTGWVGEVVRVIPAKNALGGAVRVRWLAEGETPEKQVGQEAVMNPTPLVKAAISADLREGISAGETYTPFAPHVQQVIDEENEKEQKSKASDKEDSEEETEEPVAASLSSVLHARGLITAANDREVKKGKLDEKRGWWEGQEVSFVFPLSEILEHLGQDRVAKFMKDPMYEATHLEAPDQRNIIDYVPRKYEDAVFYFPEAAQRAWVMAMEAGIENYLVTTITENVIDLFKGEDMASYEGENSEGDEVDVRTSWESRAETTGDVKGIYSDVLMRITLTNPIHVMNAYDNAQYEVDQPLDKRNLHYGLDGLLAYLNDEFSSEIRSIGDVDADRAELDEDQFNEFFEDYVIESMRDDPQALADHWREMAEEDDVTVEEKLEEAMDAMPSARKYEGRMRKALGGGFDPRQQSLPGIQGAVARLGAPVKASRGPMSGELGELLDMAAESLSSDPPRDTSGAYVTKELEKLAEKWDDAVEKSLEKYLKKNPHGDLDADTLMDDGAAGLYVWMTLQGHGVGIHDKWGSYERDFFDGDESKIDDIEKHLKRDLARMADQLDNAIYDTVYETTAADNASFILSQGTFNHLNFELGLGLDRDIAALVKSKEPLTPDLAQSLLDAVEEEIEDLERKEKAGKLDEANNDQYALDELREARENIEEAMDDDEIPTL